MVQLSDVSDLKNVNIYDSLGQLVLTVKDTSVGVSSLTPGLYLVEIEMTNGKTIKKLIVD